MKKAILTLVILVVFVQLQIPAKAQTVSRIQNLRLVANEVYSTMVTVQPYAQYRIVSDISPSFADTSEVLVFIDLNSQWALGGVGFPHRSGDAHRNVTWTPEVTEYELNITNKGHLEEVFVNLTIKQTGAPTVTVVPYDDLVARAFVPLALIIVVPPVMFAVTFALYKRRRVRTLG
ncbi:MAG: hypothetical protein ACXABV_04300 [Candidatus Thorarchaeota archaeon]